MKGLRPVPVIKNQPSKSPDSFKISSSCYTTCNELLSMLVLALDVHKTSFIKKVSAEDDNEDLDT